MLTRAPLAVALVTVAAALLLPAVSVAAAPPPPPGCSAKNLTRTNSADVPIADLATATSTVTVAAGAGRRVWDVDVRTSIKHLNNAHLDISLTSPQGTNVTLSTDTGLARDDGFDGTRFDDSAPLPITDADFPLDGGVPLAAPEGALGKFIGEDPNGTWTLNVYDDTTGTTGLINSWSLDLVTLPANAPTQQSTASNTSVFDIPDNGSIDVSIAASVPGDFLLGVTVKTKLRHTYNADLDVSLISPSGRVVVLTTDNGGANDDVFYGTVWRDDATTPVTDATYANAAAQTDLQPEGALSALIGENPNGTWVLRVADDGSGDTGSIEEFSLTFLTATGATCQTGALTVNSVSPNTGTTGGGTRVSITGTNFSTNATVLFGAVPGSNVDITSTTAAATSPAQSAGRVDVTVRNSDGEYASKLGAFNVLASAPAPVIEGLSPNTGSTAGGTAITLNARNVVQGASLLIGTAAAAQVSVVDESTVVATTGASTFGTFDIVITNPDGQSATVPSAFTYVAPAPKLSDVDPNLGSTQGGTEVTLTGDNFLPGVEVRFGEAKTEVERVDAKTLRMIAPAHPAGAVDLVIVNPDGQLLTRSRAFTYEIPAGSQSEIDGAAGCGCGGAGRASGALFLAALVALALLARRGQARAVTVRRN